MAYYPGPPATKQWRRGQPGQQAVAVQAASQLISVFPLDPDCSPFPANLTASTVAFLLTQAALGSASSTAFTTTAKFGIYTLSASTLQLINSATTTWGTNANTTALSTAFTGPRLVGFAASNFSSTPLFLAGQQYWGAIQLMSGGASQQLYSCVQINSEWLGSNSVNWITGAGALSSGTSFHPFDPFQGVVASSTGFPATIAMNAVSGVTGAASHLPCDPWVQINGGLGF